MYSSFIRYPFASDKRFSFIAGVCAVLCFLLCGSVAHAQQQMRTALTAGGIVPASSADAGYTVSDAVTAVFDTTFRDTDGNADGSAVGLVDWVEVQIRVVGQGDSVPTARGDAAEVYTKAAWLLSDGSIVDAVDADKNTTDLSAGTDDLMLTIPTGDDGLEFDPGLQKLYIVVNHRNHLPLMSAEAVEVENDVYNFDLSGGDNLAVTGTTKLVNGVHSMITGNIDGDTSIGPADRAFLLFGSGDTPPGQFGTSGYLLGDLNLSNRVSGDDRAFLLFGSGDTPPGNSGTRSPISY